MLPKSEILLIAFSKAVCAAFVLFPYRNSDGSFGNPVDTVNGFGNVSTVSSACATALNKSIACPDGLQWMTGSYSPWPKTAQTNRFCASGCRNALKKYSTAVESACGSAKIFGEGIANSYRGDLVKDYLNVMCATDTSGDPCIGEMKLFGCVVVW